ncbi:F0F1 ATP synthase subunit A [Candidatus Azambacteria bacterium]|nr:F0F1 ATP synthase subunit A [Candidatus Azambacteria bacterium]
MIEISLKAEEVSHWGNFFITNSFLLTIVASGLLIVLGGLFKKRLSLIPNQLQNFLEFVLEEFLGLMDSVFQNREKSEKYLPLIATIFLLIIISNWLGLVPGVGSIGFHELHEGQEIFVPLFRAPTADLNFTLALAITAVWAVNLLGILALGFKKYFHKFFTLENPIKTFTGLLEFLSEITKTISFSFRLFGNIFAGEVLLLIIGSLVPYFIPLPFLFLEIFVGFIQAFVFSMLTIVFISIATQEHH